MPVSSKSNNNPQISERPAESVHFLVCLLTVFPHIGSARLINGDSVLCLEFYLSQRISTPQYREFAKELRLHYGLLDLVRANSERTLKISRAPKSPLIDEIVKKRLERKVKIPNALSILQGEDGKDDVLKVLPLDIDVDVLNSCHPRDFEEFWSGMENAVEYITVERNISTVTREELEILVSLVREYFGDKLVCCMVNPFVDEDRAMLESDSLNSSLEAFRNYWEFRESPPARSLPNLVAYRDDMRVIVNKLYNKRQ